MNWFAWAFDTTDLMRQWDGGPWTAQLGWLHIISDGLIWLASLAIAASLVYLLARRRDLPFPGIMWLFVAFLVALGVTHFLEALVFWSPVYRLAGLSKLSAAIMTSITVIALVASLPRALAMRTPTELEVELEARAAQLTQANEQLCHEVQERLHIEAQIREQQEWLQVILGSIGEGIIATDEQGRVRLLNPAAEELTGFRHQEAVGRPITEVLRMRWAATGRNSDSSADCTAQRTDLHSLLTQQSVLVSRDGKERIVEQHSRPILSGGSRPAGYVLTMQDVTTRMRSEESLRLRDRAIGATSQGILITDATYADNPIVYANTGFTRITGYEVDEVVGRNCRFLQGPDSDPNVLRRIRKAIAAAVPCTEELINYRKDGTPFWNELSISPVRDDTGQLTHFVAVQTDISNRKALEEQLRQSHKMESIGRLAGGVAHDFNNLLTVVNGCCDLAMNELADHSPTMTLLREIRSAGERAANLTQQLLTLSRRQHISLQTLNLNSIVMNMEQMLRRLLGEHIVLSIDLAPDLGLIHGDRGRKEQVLLNLALNARDAMPNGGTLSISTYNAVFEEEHARAHYGARPGPYVILEIADSGVGLDEATKTRIFEPFFTTKGSGHGTGLGLAVVHGIITQAGGHIDVESQLGKGTRLRVCLPQIAVGESPTSHTTKEVIDLPTGTETILVAEDEDGVRSLVSRALTTCGYHVIVAANGSEALELASKHDYPIDLLVTDVIMPGIDGAEVARRFLKLHPHGKVLYISGYTDDVVLRSGIDYEQVNFLDKPFTASVLARKVREAIDR